MTDPQYDADDMQAALAFRFIEFNPRRASRGVEAARVAIIEDGEDCGWLWMSPNDIQANLDEFGESSELRKALAAYAKPDNPLAPPTMEVEYYDATDMRAPINGREVGREKEAIELGILSIGREWDARNCQCDPDVGAVPCHYCAEHSAILAGERLHAEVARLRKQHDDDHAWSVKACRQAREARDAARWLLIKRPVPNTFDMAGIYERWTWLDNKEN